MIRPSRLALAAAALIVAVGLAACSTGSGAPSPSTSSGTAFTWKDARGKDIRLDAIPKKVVAQSSVAAALWDDGYRVAGAYGELKPDADGKLGYQAGSLDLDRVTVLGRTYGEFDTEKYALMNPDLLVDYSFDKKALWYVPAEQADQILDLAPSLGMPGEYPDTTAAITKFLDLAKELGADTGSAAIVRDRKAYEDALDAVSRVAKESGLKVAFMSPGAKTLYVVNPAYVPETATLTRAGLDVTVPIDAADDVFTEVSWEKASDYSDVDVIFVDARTWDSEKADVGRISTWASLPAVQAGQVYPWYAAAPYSYRSFSKIFEKAADALEGSKNLSSR